VVWVVQGQKAGDETSIFRMPIAFEFELPGGRKKSFTETVEKKEHTFTWDLPAEPVLFRFDPDNWILKTTEVTKPRKMWFHQLEHDKDPMGRIKAAHQLGKIGSPEAVAALPARSGRNGSGARRSRSRAR